MNLINKIKQNKVKSTLIFIFIILLVLNILTPYLLDDYMYKYVFLEDKIVSSISDIIRSQTTHYLKWGGRTVAHTVAQFFLMFNKMFFNIANAVVFTYMIYTINKFVVCKKSLLYVLTLVFFCFFNPVLGQTMIWLTGSSNYMWIGALIISALLPFKQMVDGTVINRSKCLIIINAIIAFLAGWGSENGSGALILGMILLIIYKKFILKDKVNLEYYLYLSLTIIGFIILITAPGNYVRMNYYGAEEISFIWMIYNRFVLCLNMLSDYLFVPLVITLVIVTVNYSIDNRKYGNKLLYLRPLFYSFLGLAANFAMILSPAYDLRSLFTPLLFICVGFIYSFSDIMVSSNVGKAIYNSFAVCVIAAFGLQLTWGLIDLSSTYYLHIKRNQEVLQAKQKGEDVVKLNRIESKTKFNGSYGIYDLSNTTLNSYYAKYYGLKEVIPGDLDAN